MIAGSKTLAFSGYSLRCETDAEGFVTSFAPGTDPVGNEWDENGFWREMGLEGVTPGAQRFSDLHTLTRQLAAMREFPANERHMETIGPYLRGACLLARDRGLSLASAPATDSLPSLGARFLVSPGFKPTGPGAAITPEVLADLETMLGWYRYHQYNVARDATAILVNPRSRKIYLPNAYRFETFPYEGTCAELANTAYRDIKAYHPDVNVKRAWGLRGSGFFSTVPAVHFFLLVSDLKTCRDPYVVDPSFGMIRPLSQSGYKVRETIAEGVTKTFRDDIVIGHGDGIPLSLGRHGGLYYLGFDKDNEDKLILAFSDSREEITTWGLHEPLLTRRLADEMPRLRATVARLRKIPLIETDQEFPRAPETTIL